MTRNTAQDPPTTATAAHLGVGTCKSGDPLCYICAEVHLSIAAEALTLQMPPKTGSMGNLGGVKHAAQLTVKTGPPSPAVMVISQVNPNTSLLAR